MKFSKYIFKAVTPVMALFQKQLCCSSNKATTICGHSAESLRQMPIRHSRGGVITEIKVRFVPPTMCRLTRFVGLTEKEPTTVLTELSIYYGFKFRLHEIYMSRCIKHNIFHKFIFIRPKTIKWTFCY